MLIVDIREAETHLSRLLDRAAKGEPFIIAKAGKPRRLGFMAGEIAAPVDFDWMGGAEIERLVGGL
jgi:hypothetical protein